MSTQIEMRYTSDEGSEYLDVIFNGNITPDEWEQLLKATNQRDMEGFIPAQVGLPAPYDERIREHGLSDGDHVTTIFAREDVDASSLWTDKEPTDARSIHDFVKEFVAQKWDIGREMDRLERGAFFDYKNANIGDVDPNEVATWGPGFNNVSLLRLDAETQEFTQNATLNTPGFSQADIQRMMDAGQLVIMQKMDHTALAAQQAAELFHDAFWDMGPQITMIDLPWQPEVPTGFSRDCLVSPEQMHQRLIFMAAIQKELSPPAGAMDPYAFSTPEQRVERLLENVKAMASREGVSLGHDSVLRDGFRAVIAQHNIADSLVTLSQGVASMQKTMPVMQMALQQQEPTSPANVTLSHSSKPKMS